MNENNRLYDNAYQAITELFSDQSVSCEETERNLNGLISEIEVMLDAVEEGQGKF